MRTIYRWARFLFLLLPLAGCGGSETSECADLQAELTGAIATHQHLESLYGSGNRPITGEEDAELEQAEARLATLQYEYDTTCSGPLSPSK
jgi:hypothetical protein